MTLAQVVQQQVQEVVSVAGMKLTAVITGKNTYCNHKWKCYIITWIIQKVFMYSNKVQFADE